MLTYIIRRSAVALPLLLVITFITFSMMHLAPGGLSTVFIGARVRREEDRMAIIRHFGLDQPFHIRYVRWLGRILEGDFGHSLVHRRPVLEMIAERIPATLQLTIPAVLVSVIVAIPIGILSAVKQYSIADNIATLSAFLFVSTPSFFLGIIAIIIFSVHLGWLPLSGMSTVGLRDPTWWTIFIDRLRHLVIPGGIVLGLGFTAGLIRYMRGSMLEVINQDYIRTAQAKGLGQQIVIWKHALRNSLLPVVTILGLWVPFLLGGAMIAEVISAWPGMGRLFVAAVFARDFPLVMGINMITAALVVLGNLMADVAYAFLDPRIRYD
ncbi:ABC transporter permease [Candidatus Acetothermia bacterium]|jgi:peptide/nickel transport system permease protein|nr:ABC transporter permease [Candidatus Acetothermia bacterium]MCI2427916.1 ABC transporter permease [Candidatus Acetothermia bacterium]MCI2427964.1 ABC transporter permease [Candidatus Acetothermia bacterium]